MPATQGVTQLFQRHVRVIAHQSSQPLLMFMRDLGLPA